MTEKNRPALDDLSPRQAINKHDAEIDLFDLMIVLWKGKFVIFLSALLILMLAFVYLSFAKEKWVSKAIVTLPAVGQVANYNAMLSVLYIQSPQDKPSISDIQSQLFNRFNLSIGALATSLANLENPQTLLVKGDSSALTLSFTADDPHQAQEKLGHYISSIDNEVITEYGEDIRRSLSVKTKELSNILDAHKQIAVIKKQHRIDVIKQALKIAEESGVRKSQLNQAEFLSDDTLYLLGSDALTAMITNEASKPLNFDADYYIAERSLLSVTHLKIQTENLESFRYISKADLPLRRESPKKTLIMLFASIIGIVLGVSIVLGRNILLNYRNRS